MLSYFDSILRLVDIEVIKILKYNLKTNSWSFACQTWDQVLFESCSCSCRYWLLLVGKVTPKVAARAIARFNASQIDSTILSFLGLQFVLGTIQIIKSSSSSRSSQSLAVLLTFQLLRFRLLLLNVWKRMNTTLQSHTRLSFSRQIVVYEQVIIVQRGRISAGTHNREFQIARGSTTTQ